MGFYVHFTGCHGRKQSLRRGMIWYKLWLATKDPNLLLLSLPFNGETTERRYSIYVQRMRFATTEYVLQVCLSSPSTGGDDGLFRLRHTIGSFYPEILVPMYNIFQSAPALPPKSNLGHRGDVVRFHGRLHAVRRHCRPTLEVLEHLLLREHNSVGLMDDLSLLQFEAGITLGRINGLYDDSNFTQPCWA